MRYGVLSLAIAATLLSSCTTGGGPRRQRIDERDRGELLRGDPSKVIAAELAFARMAREKGTWTAFRATSTDDAQWPSPPSFANVHSDLEGTPDPAEAIAWAPDAVWISCDGSFALSTGPATFPNGRRTRFSTIWQRQRDGEYKWVLDQGFDLEEGYAQPEMIGARVADCPPGVGRERRDGRIEVQRNTAWGSGRSNDGTLEWTTALAADCRRTVSVKMLQGGAMTEVFRRQSSAPAAPQGQPAPTCTA
jgi:hypothetical protein